MSKTQVKMKTIYTPSWSPTGPAVSCPARLQELFHAAWDLMGVKAKHRQMVLGTKRPREEWGSFALVIRAALERLGLGGTPVATELEAWVPDPARIARQPELAVATAG